MGKIDKNINNLRNVANAFSPTVFNKIVRENDVTLFYDRIKSSVQNKRNQSNLNLIKKLYRDLDSKYRCEYVYKNNIFLNIIDKYSLEDTVTFSEFNIGNSKADLVLFNGTIRVFEIKTEFDSLQKLKKQVFDYQKIADFIFIVLNEKFSSKVLNDEELEGVGVMCLDAQNNLLLIRDGVRNPEKFDFDTIFKLLRKSEYLELVFENFGYYPLVPNTKIFRCCYEILSKLCIVTFQKQVLNILKRRKKDKSGLLKSTQTPNELKHLCNVLDFTEDEYFKLYDFLESKTLCINHI